MALISLEGPSMFVLFVVLSAIFLQQDNAYFCTKDNGDFKQIQDILSKPRMLDRQKDEKVSTQTTSLAISHTDTVTDTDCQC